jgi:hypothetical protein
MELDLKLMDAKLIELKKRDIKDRGEQPLLFLECFTNLRYGKRRVNDDEYCRSCRNYETCKMYLIAFQKPYKAFGRERRRY